MALFAVPGCGEADCDECSPPSSSSSDDQREPLPQLCERGHHAGIGQDGFHAPYTAVPHGPRALALVPRGIGPAEAAVATDAVATAYHAVHRRAKVRPRDTVFLFGLGGLGFNALQLVLRAGARRVLVADPREDVRREAAVLLGAKGAADDVAPSPAGGDGSVRAFVEARGLAGKIDTVLDFAGTHQTFEDAQHIGKNEGPAYMMDPSTPGARKKKKKLTQKTNHKSAPVAKSSASAPWTRRTRWT